MGVDASPSLLFPQVPAHLRLAFPLPRFAQIPLVVALRHPVQRLISDLARNKAAAEWPRARLLAHVAAEAARELRLLAACRARECRRHGTEDDDEGDDADPRWWPACVSSLSAQMKNPAVLRGLYGEQLRAWWCNGFANAGRGVDSAGDCFSWRESGWHRLLHEDQQSRMLVLSNERDLGGAGAADAAARVLRFAGLPPTLLGQSRPAVHNKGKYTRLSSIEVLEAVPGLYEVLAADVARVEALTGIDFGWSDLQQCAAPQGD